MVEIFLFLRKILLRNRWTVTWRCTWTHLELIWWKSLEHHWCKLSLQCTVWETTSFLKGKKKKKRFKAAAGLSLSDFKAALSSQRCDACVWSSTANWWWELSDKLSPWLFVLISWLHNTDCITECGGGNQVEGASHLFTFLWRHLPRRGINQDGRTKVLQHMVKRKLRNLANSHKKHDVLGERDSAKYDDWPRVYFRGTLTESVQNTQSLSRKSERPLPFYCYWTASEIISQITPRASTAQLARDCSGFKGKSSETACARLPHSFLCTPRS